MSARSPKAMPFLAGLILGLWGRWMMFPAWAASLVLTYWVTKHHG